MLQENSVCKEDLPSRAAQFFAPSSSAGVSGDLGTFSRAIVVEAPGYAQRRAVHSAFSFVVHVIAVLAVLWFWPLAFPPRPYVLAMDRQFVTLPFSLPASLVRASFSSAPEWAPNPFLSMKLVGPVRKFAKPI